MIPDEDIACTGLTNDMQTGVIEKVSPVLLQFRDMPDDGSKPRQPASVKVDFAELDGAADCLLIGFPECAKWWTAFTQDGDENIWAELRKLNVMCLCDKPAL